MRKLGLVATVPLFTISLTDLPITSVPVSVPVSVSVLVSVSVSALVVSVVDPVVAVIGPVESGSVVVGAVVVVIGGAVVVPSVVIGSVVVGFVVVGGGSSVVEAPDVPVPESVSVPVTRSSPHALSNAPTVTTSAQRCVARPIPPSAIPGRFTPPGVVMRGLCGPDGGPEPLTLTHHSRAGALYTDPPELRKTT